MTEATRGGQSDAASLEFILWLILNEFHRFESEDGVKVDQSGSQKQVDPKDPESIGTVMKGSYSYTAPDGKVYTVTWVADENGYQPSAAHLPVAPVV
jgi:hypothetical protein